jgi:hypothetical protein
MSFHLSMPLLASLLLLKVLIFKHRLMLVYQLGLHVSVLDVFYSTEKAAEIS